jgi:hypothetical protein
MASTSYRSVGEAPRAAAWATRPNLMTQHAQIPERKNCRPHARPFRLIVEREFGGQVSSSFSSRFILRFCGRLAACGPGNQAETCRTSCAGLGALLRRP